MPVNYNFFIHPQDRQAMTALQSIPFLDTALKAFMKVFDENMLHGINCASKIRLSSHQIPEIYHHLPEICELLKIDEPEFYLEMNPLPNAYTYGDTHPFIIVNSGLIEHLTDDELRVVIAHECGHILCHHVLYHSLARTFLMLGTGFFGFVNRLAAPLYWSLMYWNRRSEYSADRVAAYVMRDWEPVVRTMIRLSGGAPEITKNVDVDNYLSQIEDYSNLIDESHFNRFLQAWAIKDSEHPFTGVRAAEVKKWFEEFVA